MLRQGCRPELLQGFAGPKGFDRKRELASLMRAVSRALAHSILASFFSTLLASSPALSAGPSAASARQADADARMISAVAGVYRHQGVGGESIMEVVPFQRGKAYVRLRTMWSHGHSCSMYGIFRAEGRTLVHDGHTYAGKTCQFRVERRTDRLVLRDPTWECGGSCGARGMFEGDDRFRLGQRRSIRYLQRLTASDEYRAAVAADQDRIPRSETFLLRRLEESEKSQVRADTKTPLPAQPSPAPASSK